MSARLRDRRVLVHVGGSVAAVKSAAVVSELRRRGADVRVAMTRDARRFIGPASLQALSGHAVVTGLWARPRRGEPPPPGTPDEPRSAPSGVTERGMPHLDLAAWCEVQVVVGASANLVARLAHGLADDAVTTTVLACRAPLLVAPAMEGAMWEHPATMANVATLRQRDVRLIGPVEGRHASGETGPGRMAEPEEILAAVEGALRERWLHGRHVVVTAGGTREPIDPIRYIGNRSSGRMGEALALEALGLGAEVTLITTATPPSPAPQLCTVSVESAAEMGRAVEATLATADLVLMAAAVADHRPAAVAPQKLKKDGAPLTLGLAPTADILTRVWDSPRRAEMIVVGFAAETEELIPNAEEKLRRKGLDMVVANTVGNGVGMGTEDNAVTIMGADGSRTDVGRRSKTLVARAILEAVRPLLR